MTARFKWRQQYHIEDEVAHGDKTIVYNDDPSLTQQHFKDDVDINVMVKRFGIGDGAIPPAALNPRHFGDFTDAVDFREALDRTRAAQEHFDALPADLRDRFRNDPVRLFNWINDPKNDDEAVALGLLKRQEPPAPPAPTPPQA